MLLLLSYSHTPFALCALILLITLVTLPIYYGQQAEIRRTSLTTRIQLLAARLGFPSAKVLILSIVLLALCISTLWLYLGDTLFNTRGEPREALVSMAMVDTGNWILPVTNGVDLAYKPPFFHWCGAIMATISGGASEFTARFPSAIALTLIVLATFRFYATRRNVMVAFLAALITLTNFELHRAGVAARVDMVLTAAMVLALFALYHWCERQLIGIPWLAILAMSAAFLTKGPVGIVLPCGVAALYAWLRVRGFWQVFWRFACVSLASCVLPLVWYIAAYQQGGEAFWQLVYEENVLRFLGKMTYASHENPWHYNLLTIIAGFSPYNLLVLISLFVLPWKSWCSSSTLRTNTAWQRLRHYFQTMDAARLYTLLCIVVMFTFYCIPKSKRSTYLMPLYPFIAYYLAEYLLYLWQGHRRIVLGFGYFIATLSALLIVAYTFVSIGAIEPTWLGQRHMAMNTLMLDALRHITFSPDRLLLLILPCGTAIVWYKLRHKHLAMLPLMIATIFMALEGLYQPAILGAKSSYGFAKQIEYIAPQSTLYYYDNDYAVGNRMHPFTTNFYLHGRIVPFIEFGANSPHGYVLIAEDDKADFAAAYPRVTLTHVLTSDRPSPDDHAMYSLYQFVWTTTP